jgi:hypothetical protein
MMAMVVQIGVGNTQQYEQRKCKQGQHDVVAHKMHFAQPKHGHSIENGQNQYSRKYHERLSRNKKMKSNAQAIEQNDAYEGYGRPDSHGRLVDRITAVSPAYAYSFTTSATEL